MHTVLLTGATGFLGRGLVRQLGNSSRYHVVAAVRSPCRIAGCSRVHAIGAFTSTVDWTDVLAGVNTVIHAAARAHVTYSAESHAEFRDVNVDVTLELAKQASTNKINRFIFISSIGVNGSTNTRPFSVFDQPSPAEPYAQSKWDAEQGLWQIQEETGMEVVIIRSPLVYGHDAPGNFGSLVRWVEKGVPLPLGSVYNKRSLVGIDNLVDLIVRCIDHPAAANKVLLAGDGEDLSTTELLRAVGEAMGKPARLIPVPAGVLQLGATLLGKKAMAQRLLGSLQVDISKTCELLDWKPPYTVQEGLRRCFERSN